MLICQYPVLCSIDFPFLDLKPYNYTLPFLFPISVHIMSRIFFARIDAAISITKLMNTPSDVITNFDYQILTIY